MRPPLPCKNEKKVLRGELENGENDTLAGHVRSMRRVVSRTIASAGARFTYTSAGAVGHIASDFGGGSSGAGCAVDPASE